MEDEPYNEMPKKKLILRDWLAADRTVLANERTFLAYIRTALAFIVVGASLFQFFDNEFLRIIGILMLPAGTIILIVGLYKYFQFRTELKHLEKDKPSYKRFRE